MNQADIDQAILSVVEPRWHKVALIISHSAKKLGSKIPDGEEGYNLIAARIEVLVSENHLVAQGDEKKWRFGEVRLP